MPRHQPRPFPRVGLPRQRRAVHGPDEQLHRQGPHAPQGDPDLARACSTCWSASGSAFPWSRSACPGTSSSAATPTTYPSSSTPSTRAFSGRGRGVCPPALEPHLSEAVGSGADHGPRGSLPQLPQPRQPLLRRERPRPGADLLGIRGRVRGDPRAVPAVLNPVLTLADLERWPHVGTGLAVIGHPIAPFGEPADAQRGAGRTGSRATTRFGGWRYFRL